MRAERQKERDKTEPGPEPARDKRAEYLTARQLAEVLQVSEATIHRLRRSGRIPAVVLTDRLIRFNLRDVQKVLRPQASAQALETDDQQPSPQLSFEDLRPDFSSE